MLTVHNIVSVVLGLLFLALSYLFNLENSRLYTVIAGFAGYLLIVSWYNYWYLKRRNQFTVWVFLRPILLILGAFLLLLIIPNVFLKGIFLLAIVLVIASVEMFLGNFAENVLLNETLIIVFAFFLSMFALREYFPRFQIWGVVGTFFSAFLATRCFYEFVPKPNQVKFLSATAIALFCSEIFWAMTLLPFHYSALAVILFNIFYFSVILNYYAFFQTLNIKKIYFHLALLVFTSAVILLFTPWKIID
jgi:hypothetical protein